MELKALKVLEIERFGDTESGIKAGISEESLPFMFELVSKSLYSNPIGSVVREITSNCFDAHIEAGVDDPVVISKTYNAEEGWSIEFKDVGVGLSATRLVKVFMNWFSSTKRHNNEQIGGFGIGSKTPLAYADLFYITSVHAGLCYDCILHKGESKPELESMYGWDEVEEEVEISEGIFETRVVKYPRGEPTTERNGTTIKIIMERKDIDTFAKELNYQLAYFDDVYFNGWHIGNDYDIYEGNYFKFRSNMPQGSTELHIVLGKVRYPIDFTKVEVPTGLRKVPIAVKFEIGELDPTPSRENIRYNEKTILLMQERIQLAVEELMGIFQSQNPIIEDLADFTKIVKDDPKITFNAEKGHVLYTWAGSGLDKGFKFRPLAHIDIRKTPHNLFFMWERIGKIENGKATVWSKGSSYGIDNEFILREPFVIFEKGEHINQYTDAYLTQSHGRKIVALIRRREIDFQSTLKLLGLKESKGLGKAKTISEFIKIITGIVYDKGKKYSDWRPTDEWILNYKKSIKESSSAWIRKMKAKVFVRDAAYNFKGREISLHPLQNRTGVLVYGYKDDKDMLENIYKTITRHRPSLMKKTVDSRGRTTHTLDEKAFMVLQVSKATEAEILGAKKTIYWQNFMNTQFMKQTITARHMYRLYNNTRTLKHGIQYRKEFIRGFSEAHEALHIAIRQYYTPEHDFEIPDEYMTEAFILPKIMKPWYEFEKFTYNIPLLNALASDVLRDEIKIDGVIDYLKSLKIRLKNKYYLMPVIDNKIEDEEKFRF